MNTKVFIWYFFNNYKVSLLAHFQNEHSNILLQNTRTEMVKMFIRVYN